jgi:stage IV sporulation protein FB
MFGFDLLQPTPLDLRWRMFGIPVRVQPFFWLVAILMGPGRPADGVIWVLAVFVSILIHEFGHALMAKRFGWDPWIVLYGFGGLCFFQPPRDAVWRRIAVALCGPLAGFILAGVVWAIMLANNDPSQFGWRDVLLGPRQAEWPENEQLHLLVVYLNYINVWWGLVNLLPVYPLDGGQISRVFLTWLNPRQGPRWSAYLSIAVAAGIVILALVYQHFFVAILFGLMAIQEINYLQGPRWGYYEKHPEDERR